MKNSQLDMSEGFLATSFQILNDIVVVVVVVLKAWNWDTKPRH